MPEPQPIVIANDLFGRPIRTTGAELVPMSARTPSLASSASSQPISPVKVAPAVEPETPAPAPSANSSSVLAPVTDSPTTSDQAAERDRLLGLCRSLRTAHRCPGRCVLNGELERGGVAAFRSELDGST